MSQILTGHFEADGGEHDLNLGFVPDYIMIVNANAATGEVAKIECWLDEDVDDYSFQTVIIADNGSTSGTNWQRVTSNGYLSEYDETTITSTPDPVTVAGGKGVTIAAAFMDDSDEIWYMAIMSDRDVDAGDIV
jgi:hypothetical protein